MSGGGGRRGRMGALCAVVEGGTAQVMECVCVGFRRLQVPGSPVGPCLRSCLLPCAMFVMWRALAWQQRVEALEREVEILRLQVGVCGVPWWLPVAFGWLLPWGTPVSLPSLCCCALVQAKAPQLFHDAGAIGGVGSGAVGGGWCTCATAVWKACFIAPSARTAWRVWLVGEMCVALPRCQRCFKVLCRLRPVVARGTSHGASPLELVTGPVRPRPPPPPSSLHPSPPPHPRTRATCCSAQYLSSCGAVHVVHVCSGRLSGLPTARWHLERSQAPSTFTSRRSVAG